MRIKNSDKLEDLFDFTIDSLKDKSRDTLLNIKNAFLRVFKKLESIGTGSSKLCFELNYHKMEFVKIENFVLQNNKSVRISEVTFFLKNTY